MSQTLTPIYTQYHGWAQLDKPDAKAHYFPGGRQALCGVTYTWRDIYPWQGYRPQCRICLREAKRTTRPRPTQ